MSMASSTSPTPSPPPAPLPLPPPAAPPSSTHSPSPSLSPRHETPLLPPPKSSPPKKSPAFPWTHQETLALIQAYQEKWYSLKKGQLKAFQWEEVSVTVAARCGLDEPSKTSTQCRHKIEKLRKRYRSELQKPYANSWQYFELMDQMERGPMPLNAARPIAVVKSFPGNANSNSNSNSSKNVAHGYGSLYSSSSDYYNNRWRGDGGGSDESDEKWNTGYDVEAATRNKSTSIGNFVSGNVKRGVRSAKRVAVERGFSGTRDFRMSRPLLKADPRHYFDGNDSDDDEEEEDDDEDDVEEEEEEEQVQVEEEGREGGGGMELAAEIRGFAEKFMGMENKKIEMMREMQKYQMEMEKKRMEMILEAERKILDTIDRAFGALKKAKIAQ